MSNSAHRGEPLTEVADADLVLRTRSGATDAFGELWRRHHRSALTVAHSITSSLDADDLVQEAYTRIYQAIRKGGGPTGSFRAYLFTSVRNTAAGWGRSRKETNIDEFEQIEDPDTNEEATAAALDRSLTHRAFRSLPSRWQEVLWYTEIEQMKPAEIAPLLGMKATAVAQLSFRAREGLREAWIQAHLQTVDDGSEHQWTIERLGAYARNNLGTRDRARLDDHLAECPRCLIVAGEAKQVGSRLALVLLPLALGAAGATSYLAALQGGGVPLTVAIAAMPSAVTQGAVTIGGSAAGAGAVGAGAGVGVGAGASAGSGASAGAGAGVAGGTAGAAGATATVAASGAAAGGIFSGIGGTIALVTAGVVLTGGIVTAAVLPGLTDEQAPPAAQTPGDTVVSGPGIQSSSEPAPPAPTPSDLPVDAVEEIVAPVTPPVSETPRAVRPTPTPTPPAPTPTPTPPPTEPPVKPTDPPVEPTDPPVEPTEPPVEPSEPPTDPALPADPPRFSSSDLTWLSVDELYLELEISGEPGVQFDMLFFSGFERFITPAAPYGRDVRASGVIGPDGTAQVGVDLSLTEVLLGALRLQYVGPDGELGELGPPLTLFGGIDAEAAPPPKPGPELGAETPGLTDTTASGEPSGSLSE